MKKSIVALRSVLLVGAAGVLLASGLGGCECRDHQVSPSAPGPHNGINAGGADSKDAPMLRSPGPHN